MILLLGGTADTLPIANGLADCGERVLISTLTSDLNLKELDPRVETRCGELSINGLKNLISDNKVELVLDATHPYAQVIQKYAFDAASDLGIAIVRFERECSEYENCDVIRVRDHIDAAQVIKEKRWRALMTIGSRFLGTYTKALGPEYFLCARVLDNQKSVDDALHAGIPSSLVVAKRGPFTVEENMELLLECKADVIVTKDGGSKGNVLEKIEAAKRVNIPVIMVDRPKREYSVELAYSYDQVFSRVKEIREAV